MADVKQITDYGFRDGAVDAIKEDIVDDYLKGMSEDELITKYGAWCTDYIVSLR